MEFEKEAIKRFLKDAAMDPDLAVEVTAFGDTPEMQTALAELTLAGEKCATSSRLYWYVEAGNQMPKIGDLHILADGSGQPRCLIEIRSVDVKRFLEVDAAFAWDEGEGDRSLRFWRDEHRAYFQREALREGIRFSDDVEVVLERFEVIWPPFSTDVA